MAVQACSSPHACFSGLVLFRLWKKASSDPALLTRPGLSHLALLPDSRAIVCKPKAPQLPEDGALGRSSGLLVGELLISCQMFLGQQVWRCWDPWELGGALVSLLAPGRFGSEQVMSEGLLKADTSILENITHTMTSVG